jgi:nitrate reductase (cytochrome), electron transfer subunit
MTMRRLVAVAALWSVAAYAAPFVDVLRGHVPLAEEPVPPAMANQENKDVRRNRAFAMQPPTIPHKIEGYQLDRNANRCITCHARTRIEETSAIPIPATHYMDRDGTIRGDISPRRYFCTQCHVPQEDVKPAVENRFEDFETAAARSGAGAPPRR